MQMKTCALNAVAPVATTCGRIAQRPRAFTSGAVNLRSRIQRQQNTVERASVVVRSSEVDAKTDDNFIPVIKPEELPKGYRKEVRVNGKSILLFWYRNQIYAIEARSPAEGAYSEGFIQAKFNQDYCIECPGTGSLFSLKDGSIVDWYPNNPVLRMLTPRDTCRNLEIYPVKLGQDSISIDISGSTAIGGSNVTKGGSDTSLENNNVYSLDPKVYVEGSDTPDAGSGVATVATGVVAALALLGIAATGYAIFIFLNN